jgi:uncharacterized protein
MTVRTTLHFSVAGLLAIFYCTGNAASVELPGDVVAAITKAYGGPDSETRYLAGSVDLNGDGKPEIVVHVVGSTACGTGGCPTLVFAAEVSGYRLISTTTITQPPIRAAKAVTSGWRNLIVDVSGGGGKAHSATLLFDGKRYPGNPTVASAHVKAGAEKGAEVIIAAFDSFEDAKSLLGASASSATNAKKTSTAGSPSFDCAKATAAVEKSVCASRELSNLDRKLADAYTKAMQTWPDDERSAQRKAQAAWLTRRNACSHSHEPECIANAYSRRLAEIQIQAGQIEAPKATEYSCKGFDGPVTAAFYTNTEIPAAVVTMGNKQVVTFAVMSGSGARYARDNVDFWEHHGEAMIKWSGKTYTCKAL